MMAKKEIFIHKRTGNQYELLGLGTHTETKETLAIYKAVLTMKVWIRPLALFNRRFHKETGL